MYLKGLNVQFISYSFLLIVIIAGCIDSDAPNSPATTTDGPSANYVCQDCNLLLITLDTVRADHLGLYGYGQNTTPFLDKKSQDGVVFNTAITVISQTGPSHMSIFTGLYPKTHGLLDNNWIANQSLLLLPEILKEHGYTNAGFPSCFVVDDNRGFNQGFDYFDTDYGDPKYRSRRDANYVYASFSKWLDNNTAGKYFAWVHFYDVHRDYSAPEEFNNRFESRVVSKPGSDDVWDVRGYDGEIAYVDYYVGKIFDDLAAHNQLNKTIVVLVSDHGEGLGDHDYLEHSQRIWDEQLKVPLIILFPNKTFSGKRIKTPVQTIDIAPTIVDALGLSGIYSFQGRTLMPAVVGAGFPEEYTYSERFHDRNELYNINRTQMICIRGFGWKYIYNAPGTDELYDLSVDPDEKDNLIDSGGRLTRSKHELLYSKLIAWDRADRPMIQGIDVSSRIRAEIKEKMEAKLNYSADAEKLISNEENLRSLGYLN